MTALRRLSYAALWFVFLAIFGGLIPSLLFLTPSPEQTFEQGERIGAAFSTFTIPLSLFITVIGTLKGFLPGTEKSEKPQKWPRVTRAFAIYVGMSAICAVILLTLKTLDRG
jgi:hypothetical protein